MKFYKELLIIFIIPYTLCGEINNALRTLTKNLDILSQQLTKKEPTSTTKIETKTEQKTSIKERQNLIKLQENSLLQEIDIYKKDPLVFVQNLTESKLNQIKNQLIKYFTSITSLAEEEEKDIDIDNTILNFIRIALNEKSVQGAKSQYHVLNIAIQQANYDNAKKYAREYINQITKKDFVTPITTANNTINILVEKINDIKTLSFKEQQSMYKELKEIEKTIKLLMLQDTQNIESLKQAKKNLEITLATNIKEAKEILDKKYKELEEKEEIKSIENNYKNREENLAKSWKKGTQEEYNEELEKIRNAKKQAIIQYITDFFYNNQDEVQSLVDACTTASDTNSFLCKALLNVQYIQEAESKLDEWSNKDVVQNYQQKNIELSLNKLENFIRELKEMVTKISSPLEEKVKKAKITLIDRLSNFKESYTQFIKQKKQILQTVVNNRSQSGEFSQIEQYCTYLELIAEQKNLKVDHDIAFICTQAKEIRKEIEQKGVWGN